MKKLLVLLALVANFSLASDDDFAIGAIFDLDGGNDISVAVKYNNWQFDIDGNAIAADKLFIEDELSGDLGWFLGLGGYTDFDFNSFGAHIPIGLVFELSNNFDIFAQGVFHYAIQPTAGNTGIGYDLGLRYYF